MTPEDYCKNYSELSYSEASEEYKELQSESKELDLIVGSYLEEGTPQDDPKFSAAARELGDTIGKSYALCICNKEFTQSKNCQAFIEHMKKRNFTK